MDMQGKTAAILIENNYQELEFWYPYLRLQEEGIKPVIIGHQSTTYKSKSGYPVTADVSAQEVEDEGFDVLIIPGGYAPDVMRTHTSMLKLTYSTYQRGNIVAAICHAAWVLISANIVSGKKATCYHAIKDDLINAGAHYLDEPVVVDENLITSRVPSDLPLFCKKIIARLE